jgi:hypothetical protein
MATFLRTVRKSDGETRYYVGGCRVTRHVFESVGDGQRDCFHNHETDTHWRFYHCRRL